MQFLDRAEEMRRLDRVLDGAGGFAAIWGRRRVGKSRLLIEWSRRRDGLYTVADASAPAVQRRYLALAVAERFSGFADVEYPDWRAFFERLAAEAALTNWPGPFILDELPYLTGRSSPPPSRTSTAGATRRFFESSNRITVRDPSSLCVNSARLVTWSMDCKNILEIDRARMRNLISGLQTCSVAD